MSRAARLQGVLAAALCFASMGASAALLTDCVEDGGMAICSEPVIVPVSPIVAVDSESWSYGLCDEQALYLSREYWWCVVQGGTWDTSDPVHPNCLDAQPVLDPVVYSWSKTFEGLAHNACWTNDGADTGWGATIASAYCWTGSTLVRNGIAIRQYRRLGPFTGTSPPGRCNTAWSEAVSARRDRNLACPQGYTARQKPGAPPGDIQCYYLPPCCESVGNPINPAQGNKTLEETDFRSPTAYGLSIVRHFNDAGFYHRGPAATPASPLASDFWRTAYDRRLFPIAGSPSTIASVQREDGTVQYFSPAGDQLHNVAGGGNRVSKLIDGSGMVVGWIYTSAAGHAEQYDVAGTLRSITFRSGATHTLGYSDTSTPAPIAPYPGLLIKVTDAWNRAITFTYDAGGRRVTATDPMGGLYVYSYDALGRLGKVTYPDLSVRTYLYGEGPSNCSGAPTCSYALMPWTLTGLVDENGGRYAKYVYSSSGLAISSEHAGGADRVAVTYGGTPKITDALGTTRTNTYLNVLGVIKIGSIAQPCLLPGCTGTLVRTFTYDTSGNVASETDFNGKKTCFAYDPARNLETARAEGINASEACGTVLATLPARPDVRKISTQWHSIWRLPTRIAEPNRLTINAYNGDGGVFCAPGAARVAGNPIGVLCKKTVQETTDPTGQRGLAAATTGAPRVWQYTYDSFGQVLSATDPDNKTTTTAYYAANDPDLGKRGNVFTVTNPLGHVHTVTAYDGNGRPISISDPNGVATTLTYHPRGWMTSRTVAGETISYDYDGVGQLTKLSRPDGSYVRYTYDGAHRLTQIQDGLGNKIVYTLDAMGNRIKEQAYDASGALARVRQQVFDSLNRVHQTVGAQ